jgi:hypothetical protein
MGQLAQRLQALERRSRTGARDPCPEHLLNVTTVAVDWPKALRPFSPEPAERAAYLIEQETAANQPPCRRCGWAPLVVIVHSGEHSGTP